jgi:peptidoglycan-N-acetylglucosamine deacetylase
VAIGVGRARPAAVVAVAALATLSALPSQARTTPGRTVIRDRADTAGPLDLARVVIAQRGRGLVLSFWVRGRIVGRVLTALPRPGDTTPHYVCLDLHRRGRAGSRRVCLGRRGGRWRAGVERIGTNGRLRASRRIATRMLAVHSDELRARISPSAAGLGAGQYRVRATTAWSGPACGRGTSCRDRAPSGRNARFELRPLRLASCGRAGIGVVRSGPSGNGEVALTFDDGPSAYTPAVLGILNRYHVHGTFFEIGEQVSGNETVMSQILDSGDELGDHTYHHVPNAGYTEIATAQRRIEEATGFRPCLFRPPDGVYNSGTVAAATRLGMSTVLWSVDPRDWSRPGTAAIYSRVVSAARAGSIVILHDGGGDRSETVAALPRIIRTLKGRGLRLVTVSTLLGQPMRFRPATR